MKKVKVAIVQATPVVFNIEKTVEKAIDLIKKASDKGARLIVFPESFIPGYPRGMTFGAVVGRRNEQGRELYHTYWENSIEEGDDWFQRIARAAQKASAYVAMGATERDTVNSSLYCTSFYFASDGTYLGKHRKIKPTGTERIIWGEGKGETLTVIDSEIGVFGGLICWENYMPLARQALYHKGIEIYLAPTADSREEWQATMQHIALESRSFVIGCNQYITADDYPDFMRNTSENTNDLYCKGGSVAYSPLGKLLAGPVYDKEETLFIEINKKDIIKGKMDFDVVGHYARDDIFRYEAVNQPEVIKHRKK